MVDMIHSDQAFSRDDLFLLMKSYENSVQQNTILLSQQQLMTKNQEDILKKQIEIYDLVKYILEKLNLCGVNADRVEEGINKTLEIISNAIGNENQKVSAAVKNIILEQTTEMIKNRAKCEEEHGKVTTEIVKEHSNISIRLYGLYALLTGIIITLITLIVDANKKLDAIDKILKCLGLTS